jgi:hypothetical protein
VDYVNMKKSLPALVALLFVLPAVPGSLGDRQDRFSDGSIEALLTFPEKGGINNSLSIDLPKHITVNSAYLDFEGRPKSYASASGFVDYSNPAGSIAFDGNTASLPPAGKPNTLEGNNITLDAGIKSSDDRRTPNKAPNSVPYHLFEFDVSEVQLDNFDIMWEGIGTIYPSSGTIYSAGELYLYNGGTGNWELADSYSLPGQSQRDNVLWARASTGASGYPDSRGYLCVLATVPIPAIAQYTGYLESDYAALWSNGTRVLYPENVKLDLKGDGSIEWQKSGRLRGAANFTGLAFVNGLQAILDASPAGTVRIPLRFSSDKGGILSVSNLSVVYDMRNFPPETNGTAPRLFIEEDTNVSGALDLRDWFRDDAGVVNLTFTISSEQDATKVHAAINADGHSVDLFTKTADWYGNSRFRARATDVEGLYAESEFNVTVKSVNDAPRLKGAGTLAAAQGVPFDYTFTATDVDYGVDPLETLALGTNSTLLVLDPDTGIAGFTPRNADVGTHQFNVTVTDHYGASDTRNFTLRVDNRNDWPSIQDVPDQTATEDQPFTLVINASDPDIALGMDELSFEDNSPLFTISQNGTISFTPQNKDVGDHQVSVSVTDLGGFKAWANFTITVVNVNDAPRLFAIADQTVEEDEELTVRAVASDDDAGDALSFSTDDPLVKINATGWMSYKPVQKDVGVHRVNVTVRDAAGASATVSFNITVVNVNDPPRNVKITGPANNSIFKQGAEVAFAGNASDDDGDALNFTWYSGAEVIGTGATFSTKALKPGIHVITLKADDGSGPVSSQPVTITVKKKAATTPSKGFIPGFETAAALAAAAIAIVAVGWGRRKEIREP